MNKYLYLSLFLIVFSNTISCQVENPPKIKSENKISYTTEVIVDEIKKHLGMKVASATDRSAI